MKAKGLQNWMGVVSLVLLIIAIASLFTNWVVFEEGYELMPGDWEENFFYDDDTPSYESLGLFRILGSIATKGLSPFAAFILMLITVNFVNPVGEEVLYMTVIWIVIVLFVVLALLFVKLLIQRILGKKAKGILALVVYAIVGFWVYALGLEFADIPALWGFVGFAAMLASIILWTIYCRKTGITSIRKAPAAAMAYNNAQTPQMQAPYNYAQAPQMPMQPVAQAAACCGKCGEQLQVGTVFCGRCGAQQQP